MKTKGPLKWKGTPSSEEDKNPFLDRVERNYKTIKTKGKALTTYRKETLTNKRYSVWIQFLSSNKRCQCSSSFEVVREQWNPTFSPRASKGRQRHCQRHTDWMFIHSLLKREAHFSSRCNILNICSNNLWRMNVSIKALTSQKEELSFCQDEITGRRFMSPPGTTKLDKMCEMKILGHLGAKYSGSWWKRTKADEITPKPANDLEKVSRYRTGRGAHAGPWMSSWDEETGLGRQGQGR